MTKVDGILGAATILFGLSEGAEGVQDITFSALGKMDIKSLNVLKSILKEENYYRIMKACEVGATVASLLTELEVVHKGNLMRLGEAETESTGIKTIDESTGIKSAELPEGMPKETKPVQTTELPKNTEVPRAKAAGENISGTNPLERKVPKIEPVRTEPVNEILPERTVTGEGDTRTLDNITDPVAAGPSLVQSGEGYNLKEAATKISQIEGYTDVVVHGTTDSFGVWHNGKWEYINQRSLATFLKNSPEYNGGPVRLISCSTGAKPDGIAQQLANKLGVDVLAPSDTLYIYQNGSTVIGPNPYTNTGNWELFIPGNH